MKLKSSAASPNPIESAKAAGLHYVNDNTPGFTRKAAGDRFAYFDTKGKRIQDAEVIARLKSLAIPPAWTDVWLCPDPNGHVQAVGYDARGRKQYRYHPRWREVRDQAKYDHVLAFAAALPKMRRRVERDLARPGLSREKVLAAIVRLLETTFMRVGNEEYSKSNHSYGLTTIRNRHVDVRGSKIHFKFRGKSGIDHEIDLEDARLAKIIKKCQDLPEQELFEYVDDDGARRDVTSGDVNAYLKEISGQDFTAKDFRTWAGTVFAALALQEFKSFDSQAQAKRNVVAAIERVAKRLGNTKAVCRKCYVHPTILDSYLDGSFALALKKRAEQKLARSLHELRSEEAAVLAMLQQRLKRDAKKRRAA